eukprot:1898810-Amphidinium_carterae.2
MIKRIMRTSNGFQARRQRNLHYAGDHRAQKFALLRTIMSPNGTKQYYKRLEDVNRYEAENGTIAEHVEIATIINHLKGPINQHLIIYIAIESEDDTVGGIGEQPLRKPCNSGWPNRWGKGRGCKGNGKEKRGNGKGKEKGGKSKGKEKGGKSRGKKLPHLVLLGVQLASSKKNFGGSILQVGNEPAIVPLAHGVDNSLQDISTTRASISGANRALPQDTVLASEGSSHFDLVDRHNLGQPGSVPEQLLPRTLQHACFKLIGAWCTVMVSPITRGDRGVKYNAATCNFGEMRLAIRSQEQKVEEVGIGKSNSNGEHIITLKGNGGTIYYAKSLSKMTADRQSSKLLNTFEIPTIDTR